MSGGIVPRIDSGHTPAQHPSAHGERSKKAKRRRALLHLGIASGVLVLLCALCVSWIAYRGDQARDSLVKANSLIAEFEDHVAGGDLAAARSTFDNLRDQTNIARAASTDPLWRACSYLPFLGANFSAVTEISVSADDVVGRAIGPLIEDFDSSVWSKLAPVNGQIDLAAIEAAAPKLSVAANTVQISHDRLSTIEQTELLPQIAEPLSEAIEALDSASEIMDDAAAAGKLVPGMLGSDEPREYLLLIQNSAEIRATGGIPGALAVVSANDGRLELTEQGSASEMGRFDPAVIVDPSQVPIYGTRAGRFMQSVNLTPDFPTAAQTAATMWETRNEDASIDGVIGLDAVALSHILRATGPVELSLEGPVLGQLLGASGLPTTLTAENVVPTLLSDVYASLEEPSLQDAYFAAVASEVFEVLSSGTGESDGLVQSLIQSADEGRLYVWSATEEEQQIIASTGLAGSVTGAESGGATFGAYFNDGTGAKMDYYIRRTVQLHQSCTPEGQMQYTLTATLTNTAPTDAAETLPAYVTGGGAFGVPPGSVQTNFVAYGPDQSQLQTARVNGEPTPLGAHRHGDRPVGVLTTRLDPGETETVEFDFTNVVQQSDPVLDVTPTIQPLSEVVLPPSGEKSCH